MKLYIISSKSVRFNFTLILIQMFCSQQKKTLESEDEETLTNRTHNQNAQSWVFDTGPTDGHYLPQALDTISLGGGSDSASEEPNSYLLSHGSPPAIVVKVEPAPVEDRTLNHMKSFSRTPSPTFSLSHPQYEIVPEDSPARTRLYTADYIYHQRPGDTRRTHRRCESVDNRPHSASSVHTGAGAGTGVVVEKYQYASLMLELEQAIQSKRPVNESSPSSSSDPSSQLKDSDTEFSKELEAALQLLQDLGSPTTIDTPTEPNRTVLENSKTSSSRANKDQEHDGKLRLLSQQAAVDEASTSSSGYSSPAPGSSLTHLCSVVPSQHSSTSALACSIRNEGTRAIVSLYPSEHIEQRNGITTIAIQSPPSSTCFPPRRRLVSLHPEFANAIYKNESLAYLSELELLARQWRKKSEQRVREQI
jgi:hypothetical protein